MADRPIFAEMIDQLSSGDEDDRNEAQALLDIRRLLGGLEALLGGLTAFSEDEARAMIIERLRPS